MKFARDVPSYTIMFVEALEHSALLAEPGETGGMTLCGTRFHNSQGNEFCVG
jgi:hypothetical protein